MWLHALPYTIYVYRSMAACTDLHYIRIYACLWLHALTYTIFVYRFMAACINLHYIYVLDLCDFIGPWLLAKPVD